MLENLNCVDKLQITYIYKLKNVKHKLQTIHIINYLAKLHYQLIKY